MSEQHTLPLDFPIPSEPIPALREIASHARRILARKKRTNEQIINIQKLISDMVDIYWQEEREKEIERLIKEKKESLGYDYFGDEETPAPDLYPFALRVHRYGEELVFVGDEDDLELPRYGDMDDPDVLDEIIDWLVDNETSDGFIGADPAEYFSALALWYLAESLSSFPERSESDAPIAFNQVGYITEPALMAMKAMGYAQRAEWMTHYEQQQKTTDAKFAELEEQAAIMAQTALTYKNERKEFSKKGTDVLHALSREASRLVCEDWFTNRSKFKSAVDAAEHYKVWLEGKGMYNSLVTIRRWILRHAKLHGHRW